MADIAKLTVKLEAESSKLRSELEKTNRHLEGFKKRTQKTISTIASLFKGLVIGGATAALAKNFANQADQLDKLSTRLGVSVEELSRLQHVSDLTGVSFQTTTTGLQRMTRRISEAAKAGKGEAVPALQELGLSAKALQQLSPEEQFFVLADAFKEVDNQSDKVRLAMKLFDTEGVALLQTMEGGSAAIRQMADESDRLGKTISGETAKGAAAMNDAFTRLKATGNAFAQELFKNVGPQITQLTEFLATKMPLAGRIANLTIQTLITGFSGLKVVVQSAVGSLQQGIGGILSQFEATKNVGKSFLNAAADSFKGVEASVDDLVKKSTELQQAFLDTATGTQAQQNALANVVVNLDDYRGKTESAVEANKRLKDSVSGVTEAEKLRADAVKLGAQITEQFQTDSEKFIQIDNELANLLARKTISQETYNRALKEAEVKYTALGKVEEARESVLESLKTKQDEYNEAIAEAKLAFDANAISATEYEARAAQAMEQLKGKTEETNNALQATDQFAIQAARNIQSSFADFLFDPFDKGLKGMLGSLADTVRRMAAEILANAALKAALNYLATLGGGGTTGGITGTIGSLAGAALGALGGGAAADGARVKAGQPFLVGERGPELFIPNTQGVIEPGGLGGGDTNVNITVNGIRDEGGLRATANQIAGQAGSAVQRARQRNG